MGKDSGFGGGSDRQPGFGGMGNSSPGGTVSGPGFGGMGNNMGGGDTFGGFGFGGSMGGGEGRFSDMQLAQDFLRNRPMQGGGMGGATFPAITAPNMQAVPQMPRPPMQPVPAPRMPRSARPQPWMPRSRGQRD